MVISKTSPENTTAQFKHMVKKTQDPAERWQAAINLFSETYYQGLKDFSDELIALFVPGSKVCSELINVAKCVLNFSKENQRFHIPFTVTNLPAVHPKYQFTFWHNSLFNLSIPGESHILLFAPDWPMA